MPLIAKIVLELAAALITLGGLYDLLTPKLPPNLLAICGGNAQAANLVRELLRALGGALIAIGLTVGALAAGFGPQDRRQTLVLILVLVIPSEGVNSFCMYRVGSPYYVPLGFLGLTLVGVMLAWSGYAPFG